MSEGLLTGPNFRAFFLLQPNVVAVAGNRFFADRAPQHIFEGAALAPCVVWSLLNVQRNRNYCETEKLVLGTFQIDFYSARKLDADRLYSACFFALRDYVGLMGDTLVREVSSGGELSLIDPEPGLYRRSATFNIWYVEP